MLEVIDSPLTKIQKAVININIKEEPKLENLKVQLPKLNIRKQREAPSYTSFEVKKKIFKDYDFKNKPFTSISIAKRTQNIRERSAQNMTQIMNAKKSMDVAKMPHIYSRLQKLVVNNQPKIQNRRKIDIPSLQHCKILNEYKIISHIGKGCFSIVLGAVEKQTNQKCAIKTYTRIQQLDQKIIQNIQSEVTNLQALRHENVIALKHVIKNGMKIQLILQNGGQQSLSGMLRKTTGFQESQAKQYFRQMASAVAYCHSQKICHRDIKLENILVGNEGKIKLIDFGFSLKSNDKARLISFCGTPPYMSPQLASRSAYNGFTSDVWALGVSLYLMLTGKFPFKAANEKQLFRLIQVGKYSTNENLSDSVKKLLSSMMMVDQKQRFTAEQVVNCQWLKEDNKINEPTK